MLVRVFIIILRININIVKQLKRTDVRRSIIHIAKPVAIECVRKSSAEKLTIVGKKVYRLSIKEQQTDLRLLQ